LKNRRERSSWELANAENRGAFINRLNHDWASILDIKYLEQIPRELDTKQRVQEALLLKDSDLCYVISHYDEWDDQLVEYKTVFKGIYGRGLATLIIHPSADKLYLETEQEVGSPKRFLGKR
ncbi:MAG: hypothetical protein V4714_05245, partial [Bacteroidota bacterium]